MVEMKLKYEGELRTTVEHGPSGTMLIADAPVDNHGRGESFSPTDLLASALGSCMLTYIGLTGNKLGWDVVGTKITVQKEMVADPLRRVDRLIVNIVMNKKFSESELTILMNAVSTCPVKLSISEKIQVPITFTI